MVKVIPQLLDTSIQANLNNEAIRDKNSSITYKELDIAVNKMANFLMHSGVQKGDYVGLYMELSTEYVIAILAVIKVGGVFIPISPKTPKQRLQKIIQITNPSLMLTQEKQQGLEDVSYKGTMYNVLEFSKKESFKVTSTSFEAINLDENDSIYVFFTSGSTGEPKAILGRHGGLAHFIVWEKNHFNIDKSMVIGAMTPIMFDPSLRDILVPLCSGATLVIPNQEILDFSERLQWLIKEKIQLIHAVPSIYEKIHDEICNENIQKDAFSLKYILFAGEKLYANAVAEWTQKLPETITIGNLYGPSETTLAKFYYRVTSKDLVSGGIVSLGKPLPETKFYIVDENFEEVPQGNTGEIIIETPYRSKGYLQKEMNEAVFVKAPSSENIVYKTGDLGYLNEDGNLMYSGRKDFQVKINGVRIEINEIESTILEHSAIKKVTVLYIATENQEPNLVAYVQFYHAGKEIDFKAHLQDRLPTNMWPVHYIEVDEFLLNANGKIDRSKLQENYQIPQPKTEKTTVAPTTETEQKIHDIWTEVLKKDVIGIHDDFFEIGGHSLNALVIISKLHKKFGTRFEIESFFLHTTIHKQAIHLFASSEDGQEEQEEIPKIPIVENPDGIYITSSGQKRMFVHSKIMEDTSLYNITGSYCIDEKLAINVLEVSLGKLVERHQTLRTIFLEKEDEVYQKVLPKEKSAPKLIIHQSTTEAETTILLKKEFIYSFDLEKETSLRVGVIQEAEDKVTIFYCMHHIISDGWSLEIFINDLLEIYDSLKKGKEPSLPEMRIQYKDYATYERNNMEQLEASKIFWNTKMSGEVPILDFPTNFERPLQQTYLGDSLDAFIPKETVKKLRNLCNANQTTYFSGLMATLYTLLYKYSGQQDIAIGIPIANRDNDDLHPQIGLFVNTLVMREAINPELNFTEFLRNVKKTMFDAFKHKNYPLDQLVEDLGIERDVSRNPLFDVMVNFQTDNKQADYASVADWNITELEHMEERSKFDFSFYFYDLEDTTKVSLIYNTNLFTKEFIENLLSHFLQLVATIATNPNKPLTKAQYLPDHEVTQIVSGFNSIPSYPTQSKTLLNTFKECVSNYAENNAIITDNGTISYAEIDTLSTKLANALLEEGIQPEDKIIINTKRDKSFLVSILACLKTGAIYIPLDQETPELLKNDISIENACKVIIDSEYISKFEKNSETFSTTQPSIVVKEDAKIAILYTTGSTNKPKGVLINQKNIINRLEWMWNTYPFQSDEVCCLKTSISFVDHIWEAFGPLLKGVPLVCFNKMEQLNIPKFITKLEKHQVSRIVLVPSLLKQILKYVERTENTLSKLHYWICSGEVLPQKIIHEFYTIFDVESTKLLNIYGSTEVTADATCFDTSTLFANKEVNLDMFETSIENEIETLLNDFDTHEKITHYLENNEYLSAFNTKATTTKEALTNYLQHLKEQVLPSVINISQTKFIGHMTGPLPSFVRSMSNLVTHLNQNLVKTETSGVATMIEIDVIKEFHKQIFKESEAFYTNYNYAIDGILGGFTNGGTLSNITVLYYAMNNCFPANDEFEGYAKSGLLKSLKYYDYENVVILGSRFCHYSFEKALKLFGLGKDAFILLDFDAKTPEEIKKYITEKVTELRAQKTMILSLVGIAGTTETGEVEPISILGDISQDLQIHFHVDAAFGSAYLFSEKNKYLLKGISKADSITICHHKQFYTPIGTSMFVLKTSSSALNSEINSRYQARKGSYDLGKFSIEGTRNFNSLIVHGLLNVFGSKALGQVIDHNHNTAYRFGELITQYPGFELYQEPTMNIVLYRYIPVNFQGKQHTEQDVLEINTFNTEIQQTQFKKGDSFVSYTTVKFKNTDAIFFRTVLLNPYTTSANLKTILEEQLEIAYQLEAEKFGTTNLPVFKIVTPLKNIVDEGSIIGKPISNVKIYILDQDLQIVPVGVQGMIYVAGKNITEGYVNDAELTQLKFISNPLNVEETIYNTGDYGKWTNNGNIVYLGRKDEQHKIRGNRVNTLYLEKVFCSMPAIQEAVIIFEEDHMEAFMTLKNVDTDLETIQQYLNKRLPKYMLPSKYIVLENFPKNTSGKIDKKQLRVSLGTELRCENIQVLPSNETEEKALVLWEQIFEKKLSVKDDFFLIGGHSLNLMKLMTHYTQKFGVQLDINKLFLHRTIVEHAVLIQEATKKSAMEKRIPQAEEQEAYPLSYGQESLMILSQIKEAKSAYNMPFFIELDKELSIENLNKAVNSTIERHEILRTVFKEDVDGIVKQWILPTNKVNLTIDYHDFSKEKDAEQAIQTYISKDSKIAFDLTNGPLVRISVLQYLSRTIFYYNMHHIISDAWSMDILYKDVIAYYNLYEENSALELPELSIQYKDYAVWQKQQQTAETFESHKAYWKKTLQGELPILNLPNQKQRPPIRTHNGKRYNTYLPKTITQKLREFCLTNDGTVFMGLLSSLHVLLLRYTNETDIIIGTPVAGRDHVDLEHQIGFYANAIALRNNISLEANFKEILNTIKENTLAAYQHKSYPFNLLLEELRIRTDMSRSSVFDLILTHQDHRNTTEEILEEEGWLQDIWDNGERLSKFDLEVTFQEIGDYISFEITYNIDVYKDEMIQQFMIHFKQMLTVLLENSETSVGKLNFLEEESEKITTQFAEATQKELTHTSIINLFGAQVQKTPHATAVVYEDTNYTYQELDELSNQIAHCLQQNYNIKKGSFVGIKLEPNEWVMPVIIGILKAGGIYVIIEPSLPENKEAFIMENSNIELLITDTSYMLDIIEFDGTIFAIDVEFTASDYEKNSVTNIPNKEDIAYMIYTSGSTGNSKGVMIAHESLANYALWAKEVYSNQAKPIHIGLFTSLAFDLTLTSLFLPIISGGTLKIMNPHQEIADTLKAYLNDETLTHIKLTPAHINLIRELNLEKSAVLTVIVGGDILERHQVETIQKLNKNTRIFNEYGPTETTVGCTYKEITDVSNITIGRPIHNTKIYILNEFNQIQPIGIEGELCISGKGVAVGYLNQDTLTKEKFIKNPFDEDLTLYKTGDIVKWLPNGELAFIGRKDDQIKIDGYRIEPGEIQNVLLTKTSIKEAVILVQETALGYKELSAYIVSDLEENVVELKSRLSNSLSSYMIPHHIIQLEKIPLTTNGKVDKKALLNTATANNKTTEPPRNETDEKVLAIWQRVFEFSEIGIDDNIFEIGGNSLKVMHILNEVNSGFKVDLELHMLMHDFTVRHISNELEKIIWYAAENNSESKTEEDEEKEFFSI